MIHNVSYRYIIDDIFFHGKAITYLSNLHVSNEFRNPTRTMASTPSAVTVASPTSVIVSTESEESQDIPKTEQPWWDMPLRRVTTTWHQIESQIETQKAKFALDRPFIMACGIIVVLCCLLLTFGILLVTSPLWILSSPIWVPVGLISSPLWIPVALFLTGCLCFGGSIFVFFALPEEWLPSSHKLVPQFVKLRQSVEGQVLKYQAKVVLYAAGVGPAADAVMMAWDRIDLESTQRRLAQVDWNKVQNLEFGELQGLVMEAARALLKVG